VGVWCQREQHHQVPGHDHPGQQRGLQGHHHRDPIESAVRRAGDQFSALDVLVANAVRWPVDARGALGDVDAAVWLAALRANLEGTILTVRAALPFLLRSDAARVVLISSGVSRHGLEGATTYSTAKAGLDGLLASLKWELGPAGVLVNIISPGFTVTETNLATFSDQARESVRVRTPTGRLSIPDDVARAVLFSGSSGNTNVTGAYLPVAGGID
jgi:NAD(P)-dependent dehydrogenase (short-subunit alcohol dehydrogenase family)